MRWWAGRFSPPPGRPAPPAKTEAPSRSPAVPARTSGVERDRAAVSRRDGGLGRVAEDGVGGPYGVSRQTVHSWTVRYQLDGLRGLEDRSHRPASCPHRVDADVEALVCTIRRDPPRDRLQPPFPTVCAWTVRGRLGLGPGRRAEVPRRPPPRLQSRPRTHRRPLAPHLRRPGRPGRRLRAEHKRHQPVPGQTPDSAGRVLMAGGGNYVVSELSTLAVDVGATRLTSLRKSSRSR